MKSLSVREKFIELRANGLSFENISSEINVSKNTLIEWQKKYNSEINNLKFFNIDMMLSKHYISKEVRVNFFLEEMNKIIQEIKSRDYKTIQTKDLFLILNGINEKLTNELDSVFYTTEEIKENFSINMEYESLDINF